MANHNTQAVLFPDLLSKPVFVKFDEPDTTSDGGALLLKAVDEKLRLTEKLADCLVDSRQQSKIRHTYMDILRQRIYGLACGYSDANDVARIGKDPMHKLLLDRDPFLGEDLASQPTLSRFENGQLGSDLYRMGETLMEAVIWRHRRRFPKRKAKLVTVDLDATYDAAHGQQQLALFNGHFGNWCYLPLLGFLSFNDEPEQYLFAAILRPGNSHPHGGAFSLLKRVLPCLRAAFPFAVLRVRLDGGFFSAEMLAFLEEQQVEYLIAIRRSRRLLGQAKRLLTKARWRSWYREQSAALYGETMYLGSRWPEERRVVFKAEYVRLAGHPVRENLRFVVTNLDTDPEETYRIYGQRGDSENRIKELKNSLYLDRTSCSRFLANQVRVFLTAGAYVLMQELRLRMKTVAQAAAQIETLRLMLLKVGGRIERSARRIVIHLAENHPWQKQWYRTARAWGAAIP